MARNLLLLSGVLSSLLYLLMNVIVPMQWDDYSVASQTVSELSAIGAPTRPLWVPLAMIYSVLLAAFGLGVRAAGRGNRALRIAGTLLMAQAILGLFWPPMHLRGAAMTLTDVMHIAFAIATVTLMLAALACVAAAFRAAFRRYTIVTIALFVAFGVLTGIEGPRLASNLPTPWIGVWERINIGVYMLWIAALSTVLLRSRAPEILSLKKQKPA